MISLPSKTRISLHEDSASCTQATTGSVMREYCKNTTIHGFSYCIASGNPTNYNWGKPNAQCNLCFRQGQSSPRETFLDHSHILRVLLRVAPSVGCLWRLGWKPDRYKLNSTSICVVQGNLLHGSTFLFNKNWTNKQIKPLADTHKSACG